METDPDVWAEIVDNYRNEENKKNNHNDDDEQEELELKLKPLTDEADQIDCDNATPKKKRIYKTKKRKDYAKLLDESTELSNDVILEQIKNTDDIVDKYPRTRSSQSVSKKYAQLVREPCRELRPTLAKLFTRNLREKDDPETNDSISDFDQQDEQCSFDNNSRSECSDYNNTFDFPADDSDDEDHNFHKNNKTFKRATKHNNSRNNNNFNNTPEKSILDEIDPDFKPTVFATRSYARRDDRTQ